MKLPNFSPNDALLIIDMQKDFCPSGGELPVTDCSGVVKVLNAWIAAAEDARIPIFASRDWHPPDHVSFDSQGGSWPEHCVRGTEGAEFCEELQLPPQAVIISKGTSPSVEQYSPFENTGLADSLRELGIQRLWMGGVAQDVCVRASALDALQEGFDVHVVVDATAPVEEQAGRRALREMQSAGAILE